MASVLDLLRWVRHHVGSDGYVCLVDCMGKDADIVNAAAVSYGKDARDGETQTNMKLINYLMRHGHTTPFEMCEVKFLVRVPMDCWRQWIRHRTANVNEYSTRYKPAIDSSATTMPHEWRLQSTDNKQGSDGSLPSDRGVALSETEERLHIISRDIYNQRLALGVAREQARKDLPLSTYTEAYWKCDLHNIFNFLRLRLDSHAQLEIREYAQIVFNIVNQLFPLATRAFVHYQLESTKLSLLEASAIRHLNSHTVPEWPLFTDKREWEECLKKLTLLGFNTEEIITSQWLSSPSNSEKKITSPLVPTQS